MNRYAFAAIAASICASGLSGCATITEGKTDSIALTSVPVDGAKCSLKNGVGEWFITTPGSAEVHKSKTDLEIDCTKDGYQPVHATMNSHLEGMTAGNLILGGVIGIGVDAASGAMNHYDKQFQVTLVPIDASSMAAAPVAVPPPPAPATVPTKPNS